MSALRNYMQRTITAAHTFKSADGDFKVSVSKTRTNGGYLDITLRAGPNTLELPGDDPSKTALMLVSLLQQIIAHDCEIPEPKR